MTRKRANVDEPSDVLTDDPAHPGGTRDDQGVDARPAEVGSASGTRRGLPVLRKGRGVVRLAALLALLAAVGGVWTYAYVAAPAAQLTVAFIGDSYTSGSNMGGNGDNNYTRIIANQMGWKVVNNAAGGTGYVKDNPNARPFEAQQLAAVVAARPDVVVVVGSRNDIDESPQAITDAAAHLYRSIHDQLPDAKLLVVGPIWPGGAPPAMDRVRTAVLRAAEQENATVVDPIADHWLDDGTPGLIGSDGVHPNDAGHRYIAERMLVVLKRTTTITQ